MTTPATFQMGTAESLIDKSLDDIIKERRKEMKKPKTGPGQNGGGRSGTRRPAHRKNVKQDDRPNPSHTAKPTQLVDKSVGKNKASRSAKIAAKRGLQKSAQPTPMEVEKEVYRQQRSRIPKRTPTGGGGGRDAADSPRATQSRRIRRKPRGVNISSMTEGKVNSQRNNKQSLSMGKTLPTERKTAGPPPKKAVEAAVMAMSKAGYQPPKGMKMEIRFVEKK